MNTVLSNSRPTLRMLGALTYVGTIQLAGLIILTMPPKTRRRISVCGQSEPDSTSETQFAKTARGSIGSLRSTLV